jgi:hypothetical protein
MLVATGLLATNIATVPKFVIAGVISGIFFRKSFRLRSNWTPLVLLLGIYAFYHSIMVGAWLIAFAGIGAFSNAQGVCQLQRCDAGGDSQYDFQDLVNFCLSMACFVLCYESAAKFNIVLTEEDALAASSHLLRTWRAIPTLAFFQVTRNPVSLRNILRPIRVGLGPSTLISTLTAGYLQLQSPWSTGGERFLAVLSMLSSFAACVIFRPDNNEVLELFLGRIPPSLGPMRIKNIHGILNVFSLICAITLTEISDLWVV